MKDFFVTLVAGSILIWYLQLLFLPGGVTFNFDGQSHCVSLSIYPCEIRRPR